LAIDPCEGFAFYKKRGIKFNYRCKLGAVLNITEAKNAVKIGEFGLRKNHANKIELKYGAQVPQSLLTDNAPRVYLFVVDGEIVKIGGSASKGGIKATMNFYVAAMQGSPGRPRFIIHLLIEEALKLGKAVSLWMIVSPSVLAPIYGLSRVENVEVSSFKEMEDLCKEEYFEREKSYPIWNFQENGAPYPKKFDELHNKYHANRLEN
jgi:hypothetical protein